MSYAYNLKVRDDRIRSNTVLYEYCTQIIINGATIVSAVIQILTDVIVRYGLIRLVPMVVTGDGELVIQGLNRIEPSVN